MTDKENQPLDTQQSIFDDGISLRIKSAREAKKLSQIDMHKITGLSRTVLINYEAGRHKPGAREIKLICDALQISPNYLIYGTEEPHKIEDGLAGKLLSMGEEAFMPLIVLVPILAGILDHEEKRTLLKLVEALIKAKSQDVYNDIMSVLNAIPKRSEIDTSQLHSVTELQKNPDLMKEYIEKIKTGISKVPRN
jgi:transcriptional regulator with XRE-family HTH domain